MLFAIVTGPGVIAEAASLPVVWIVADVAALAAVAAIAIYNGLVTRLRIARSMALPQRSSGR